MKHYYIKDNRIWMANEKMPVINEEWHTYNANLLKWSESLQPCEISESEFYKIHDYLIENIPFKNSDISNPIDVTDLVSDNNGVITFKEKQVDGEIEAVGGYVSFNVNGIISGIYSNLEWLKEDYPKSGYYKLTTLRNI